MNRAVRVGALLLDPFLLDPFWDGRGKEPNPVLVVEHFDDTGE